MDPFSTLAIPRLSSLEEVKAAYKRLALRYHPDKAGKQSTAKFQEINAAYEKIIKNGSLNRQAGKSSGTGTTNSKQKKSQTAEREEGCTKLWNCSCEKCTMARWVEQMSFWSADSYSDLR